LLRFSHPGAFPPLINSFAGHTHSVLAKYGLIVKRKKVAKKEKVVIVIYL